MNRWICIIQRLTKYSKNIGFKQLIKKINTNELPSDFQFGFKTGLSASDSFIWLPVKKICNNFTNKVVFPLIEKFHKSFSYNNNNNLILKLNKLGFNRINLQCLKTYLKKKKSIYQIERYILRYTTSKYGCSSRFCAGIITLLNIQKWSHQLPQNLLCIFRRQKPRNTLSKR